VVPASAPPPYESDASRWRTSLITVLDFAMLVIDELPIRDARDTLGDIVSTIKKTDIMKANAKTLGPLQTHVKNLCAYVVIPLSQMKEEDILMPGELKSSVERLVNAFRLLVKRWTNEDAVDLGSLAKGIEHAVAGFSAEGSVNVQLSNARQERAIEILRDQNLKQEQAHNIEVLKHADEANYDYNGRPEVPSCLEGTRAEVLGKITTWIEGASTDANQPRIFWLNGMAGVGKSAISRSIAEWAKGKDILGANVFCARGESKSRDMPNLRNPALVFPTFAYQLAHYDAEFKRELANVLSHNPDVANRDFVTQFEQLIRLPWTASRKSESKTVLVVLEAMDECEEESEVEQLLETLLATSMPDKFLFFLASRPEDYIRSAFRESDAQKFVSASLEAFDCQADIEKYLFHYLSDPPPKIVRTLPRDWPNDSGTLNDIRTLAKDCGCFFIYAAMALPFIFDNRVRNPPKQLKVLVDREFGAVHPYTALDDRYLRIIDGTVSEFSTEDDVKRIKQAIVTMTLIRTPIPMNVFAGFLRLQEVDLRNVTLHHLHSLIIVPDPGALNGSPHIFHLSFRQFITDPRRCLDSRFYFDSQEEEARMCLRCFEVMGHDLDNTMRKIKTNRDLRDIRRLEPHRINHAFAPLLQYACEFWAEHLLQISLDDFLWVEPQLRDFANRLAARWFDAMSWLGKDPAAILKDVIKWMDDDDLNPEISDLLSLSQQNPRDNRIVLRNV